MSSNASTKNSEDLVQDRMRQLTNDREALREAWDKRSKQLKQCSELQQFLRDAEQVDSATGAQEAFLSNDDLGVRSPVLLHARITESPKQCAYLHARVALLLF